MKGLLGKAFGAEPPLSLDREAILRRGRRQVRVRRLAASGGVAAAVVAVVLGAATLSNLPGDGGDIAPAQSGSITPPYPPTTGETAPQGPQLPLTTTTAPADQRAVNLTKVLADAGLIPSTFEVQSRRAGTQPLTFVPAGEMYLAEANLKNAQGSGTLQIEVRRAKGAIPPVSCATLNEQVLACTVEPDQGIPVLVATQRSSAGLTFHTVHVVRPDGTVIDVVATNEKAGAKPVVDTDVLRRIATLPRLTLG